MRIAIIGAGFVGTYAARLLKRRLGDRIELTLIDPKDHFLFSPLLINALGSANPASACPTVSLKHLAAQHDFHFLQGSAKLIDQERKIISFTEDLPSLPYDLLIISPGAESSYYNIPGAKEHTLPLKQLVDVHVIHERIETRLEQSLQAASDDARRALLSFVVIGGGPSGVESVFAVKQRVEKRCEEAFPALRPFASFTLIQAAPQILPGFSLAIIKRTLRECTRGNIRILVGETVTSIEETSVHTTRSVIPNGLTLWAAGIQARRIPTSPDLYADPSGGLVVDRFLRVTPTIFAAGDVITYKEQNLVVPKNAQTAIQMAKTLVDNIWRYDQKQEPYPFQYRPKGNLFVLGATGIADLRFLIFTSRLIPWIRGLFYRLRYWQITGE